MTEETYSLSELSRLCGRSKSTLQAMIAEGELKAKKGVDGRGAWSIRHADAIDVGLVFRIDHSIDAALRTQLHEQFGPLIARLDLREQEIDRRLEQIQFQLKRISAPPPSRTNSKIRRVLHALRRLVE